jgi:hypothetical protein
VAYFFYIRVILNRLPRELIIFQETFINYRLLFILITGIGVSSLMIIISILKLLHIELAPRKSFTNFNEIINKALEEVYGFIFSFFENPYEKTVNIADKFYKIFGQKTEGFFIYISYTIQFIILVSFLIDVFWFFKLELFYKALSLLIITIAIKILFFSLRLYSTNLSDLESMLVITTTDQIDPETNTPIVEYSPIPQLNHVIDFNFSEHMLQYKLCSKINGYLEIYDLASKYFSARLNLIIYPCYLIGWIYILYQNIFLYFC